MTRIQGQTHRGHACSLIDDTGDALAPGELERLLAELIAADAFGFRASGAASGVALDRPSLAHVQIAGRLYRLLVMRYEARLEKF